MERWKATVAAGEGDEEGRKGERKKVEKLEALLKVGRLSSVPLPVPTG